MREILFRGKRIDNGEWVEGGCYCEKVGEYLTAVFVIEPLTSGVRASHRVDPSTVGQYTGLKDKHGKRIFEGDIVQYYSDYKGSFSGEPAVVEYGEFNCTCCNGVYGWTFGWGDIREHEGYVVIGNIHDNPELMEER